MRSEAGRIINISSSSYWTPPPPFVSYVSAKGALNGFTSALSASLGPHGITANAIDPGPADTELYRQAMARLSQTDYAQGSTLEEHRAESASHVPLKRLASTEDIAQLYLFLASDASDFITGATIAVDGGVWMPA